MELSPRRFALLLVVAVGLVAVLYQLIGAAGHGVALAVAVTALAVLVAVYVGAGLLMLRALRDQRARELLQRRGQMPVLVMLATPLILIAAHPWGAATMVVGLGVMLACQFFLHAMVVVVAIRGRRTGTTRPQ